MDSASEKKEFRKKMKAVLQDFFLKNDIEKISCEICRKVVSSSEYKNAKAVLCFLSSDWEIDTSFLVKKILSDEKILACPRVVSSGIMEFRRIDKNRTFSEQVEKGSFNISEPNETCAVFNPRDFAEKILVVVPGVAFTKSGKRLGHGKGFYDRFLPQIKSSDFIAGLCLPCQIVENLPCSQTDFLIPRIFF